jgi:hypothetical protein
MAHGPGMLISSRVFVWQIIAFRINVPGWSAHADGGSGVVTGASRMTLSQAAPARWPNPNMAASASARENGPVA